jgi:hypothetical protein
VKLPFILDMDIGVDIDDAPAHACCPAVLGAL